MESRREGGSEKEHSRQKEQQLQRLLGNSQLRQGAGKPWTVYFCLTDGAFTCTGRAERSPQRPMAFKAQNRSYLALYR